MLLSKSFNQPVVISPAKPPPASAVDYTQPFFEPQPTERPPHQQLTNRQATLHQQPAHQPKSDNRPVVTDQPATDQVSKQAPTTSAVAVTQQGSDSDMETSSDSDSDSVVRPHFTGQAEECGLSDLDQDITVTDTDQAACEEQNYRETMYGVSSYMDWSHIPDMHSNISSAEDNLCAAPKQQPAGRFSVNLLLMTGCVIKWTLEQGYPSRSSEAGWLQRDQFVKTGQVTCKVVQAPPQPAPTIRISLLAL